MTAVIAGLIALCNASLPATDMAAHLVKLQERGGPPAAVMYGVVCVETGGTWYTHTLGTSGEWGLTQVHPCHKALHAKCHTGWVGQLDAGAEILMDCRRRHPDSWKFALADYNGGPGGHHKRRCLRYADRVLAKAKKAR